LIEVFTIPTVSVDAWWSELKPHLERFERETQRTDAETIRAQAKAGERQIWCLREHGLVTGVIVTEIYRTARGLVCWLWHGVGTMPEQSLEIYNDIEKWARSIGCVSIGINGRKGWLRVLPGFKQTAIVIEKDLRE
jgi:hypothetical protein